MTHPELTSRENEVLNLAIQGKSNTDIARILFIAVSTAKAHMHSIMTKLNVASRTELVAKTQGFRVGELEELQFRVSRLERQLEPLLTFLNALKEYSK